MFFSQPHNLVGLFPSLPFFFLSVETETESSSASITNIKPPDSILTERRPAPLRPAPLNHRRINITIGGWRAFRFKWCHIVRGPPSWGLRVPSCGRQPPPLPTPPRSGLPGAVTPAPREDPAPRLQRRRRGRGSRRAGRRAGEVEGGRGGARELGPGWAEGVGWLGGW